MMLFVWWYKFKRNGKMITVLSRMPVTDFEELHNCFVEDLDCIEIEEG